MKICIYEDQGYRDLLPLTYFRPAYSLRCGMTSLLDKILRCVKGDKVILQARDYLVPLLRRDIPACDVKPIPGSSEDVLYLNGRALWDQPLIDRLKDGPGATLYQSGGTVVAAKLNGNHPDHLASLIGGGSAAVIGGLATLPLDANIIEYPWDLVHHNGGQIGEDFQAVLKGKPRRLGQAASAHLINEANIHLAAGSVIQPGAVLDAGGGPIYIGKNSRVMSNAVIEGPVFIGADSLIKIGAKIYENTSIGEVCKVGGEVEESILHSFTNKQHEGFLGHAYLGSWVNVGADSNNSDLKNDYGIVKVIIDGQTIDSGSMFVGLFMGDHSKCGINTMFNTGTVVGVNCNLFGPGLHPKFLPSFTWGGNNEYQTYRLEKACRVATAVMKRRKMPFSALDRELFETVFKATRPERDRAGLASA